MACKQAISLVISKLSIKSLRLNPSYGDHRQDGDDNVLLVYGLFINCIFENTSMSQREQSEVALAEANSREHSP